MIAGATDIVEDFSHTFLSLSTLCGGIIKNDHSGSVLQILTIKPQPK
jgi:hypothetical protein